MNFSSKACILKLVLKISCKGQEVRDAVVVCELCSNYVLPRVSGVFCLLLRM